MKLVDVIIAAVSANGCWKAEAGHCLVNLGSVIKLVKYAFISITA